MTHARASNLALNVALEPPFGLTSGNSLSCAMCCERNPCTTQCLCRLGNKIESSNCANCDGRVQ
jgi:hypothetical protein